MILGSNAIEQERKVTRGNQIRDIEERIAETKEALEKQRKEIVMLDYLLAKLKELIAEDEAAEE